MTDAKHEAPAEGWSCPANHDDYARMGHGACPYCRASLEGIRAAFIAPAEGAGEIASAARALLDACYKADENSDLSDFVDGMLLTRLDKALRARSSAPEARGGEAVAWKFRNLDLRQVGVTMDRREADRKAEAGWEIEPLGLIVQPAAPSADKLRDHLEWIETVLTDPVPGYTARIATAREYIDKALAALKAEAK